MGCYWIEVWNCTGLREQTCTSTTRKKLHIRIIIVKKEQVDKLNILVSAKNCNILKNVFPFIQFFSVFDNNIGKWITSATVLISFFISYLARNCKPSKTSILSIVKVLLEQGDPFSASMANFSHFRPIKSGILLAGVVISNTFMSNNVYNIVLPRQRTPFQTVTEFFQHNSSVYGMLKEYYGGTILSKFIKHSYLPKIVTIDRDNLQIKSRLDNRPLVTGHTEIGYTWKTFAANENGFVRDKRYVDIKYVLSIRKVYLGIVQIFEEPFRTTCESGNIKQQLR